MFTDDICIMVLSFNLKNLIQYQVAHSRKEPATALPVAFGGERKENYRSVALETIFCLSEASLKSFSEA